MNKLETARQLAKQTIEQKQYTEIAQSSEKPDKEVMDFLQTLHQIQKTTITNQQSLGDLKMKISQVETNHWRQIRMLIFTMVIPLIMTIITLSILLLFK